ncbi:hypothetical protein TNCV_2431221 [Trichonephila clavipes]|nr:hypothetical protein TNCV_2431221 [Trichonephila clavipes]
MHHGRIRKHSPFTPKVPSRKGMKNAPAFRPGILPGRRVNGYKNIRPGLETLWCSKLTTWTRLAQAVLDVFWASNGPNCVFQRARLVFENLSTMHWPEKTQCGHAFHLRCLLRHLYVSHTCPYAEICQPLAGSLDTALSPRKWENDYWKGA